MGKRPSHPAFRRAVHGLLPMGRRHTLTATAQSFTREALGQTPLDTTASLDSMRESVSLPLHHCSFSVPFLSRTGRVLAGCNSNLQGKQPQPLVPGPQQCWAGPSGRHRCIGSFLSKSPESLAGICKSCQKLRHSAGTAGCLFPTTAPLPGGTVLGRYPVS